MRTLILALLLSQVNTYAATKWVRTNSFGGVAGTYYSQAACMRAVQSLGGYCQMVNE